MSKRRLRLVCVSLFIATLSAAASTSRSIQTKIVPGGEVSITDMSAIWNGQSITVSGDGVEVFQNRTCGYPEIDFDGSKGRILLRIDSVYEIYHVYPPNSRPGFAELSRRVTFSVTVPASARVALVVVRHHSTGGCDNSSTLKYAFDWLLNKVLQNHKKPIASSAARCF